MLDLATKRDDAWSRIRQRLEEAFADELEIGEELGRGGMAAVFLAHDRTLDRKVAVKVLAPGLLTGPGMVDRFKREAVTVAGLRHPHIVNIFAVRHVEDLHCIVMEYIDGHSLDEVLRGAGPLPIDVTRAILYQVGSALGYAHRRGIVHRDVKPANVLFDSEGNAVIMDFGIAKVTELPGQTQTGVAVGTPAYMSPEQCYAADDVDEASDQYSLGVVAYEMLTGRKPFSGTAFAVMQAHTKTPPPAVRPNRPDCPADLEAAVLRMLVKSRGGRFPSMTEALEGLQAAPVAAGDPLRARLTRLATAPEQAPALSMPADTPGAPPPARRLRGRAIAGIAVAATAIAATVLAIASQRSGRPTVDRGGIPSDVATAVADSVSEPAPEPPPPPAIPNQEVASSADLTGSTQATTAPPPAQPSSTPQPAPTRVTQVVITPPPGPIAVGQPVELRATIEREPADGPYPGVTWRSSDPTIATVTAIDSTRASLNLLAPGTVTVTVDAGNRSGSVALTVGPGVSLEVSRSTVSFAASSGGTPPPSDEVQVQVRGTATGQAALRTTDYIAGATGWLTAVLQGSRLELRASPSGIPAGTHRARVTVSAEGVEENVTVEFRVSDPVAIDPVAAARPAIEALLDRYQRALNSGDAAGVTDAFPSIPKRDLDALMGRRISDRVEILLRSGSLRVGSEPDTLEGDVTSGMLGDRAGRIARFVYVFARAGSGWIIKSTRNAR